MQTVYILGAGASAASVAPGHRVLGNNLLHRAFPKTHNEPNAPNDPHDERLESIKKFVGDFFHCDVSGAENLPTVEEVLSAVDIALERGEALSVAYTQEELQKLRRNFAYLIYRVLDLSYEHLANDVTQRFVRRLEQSPTIISFNYDVIMDSALSHYCYSWPDYGIDFRAFEEFQTPKRDFVTPGTAKLYKIHGSLNWMVCPTCGVVYVGRPEMGKIVRYTFGEHVSAQCAEEGHALLEPLLITPTYLKHYARPQASLIWQWAERALRDAQRLIFIGYSLPDADYQIKYLLQKALFRTPAPQVVVIDRERSDYQPEQPTPEELSYKRLFGPAVEYRPIGFHRLVEEMELQQPMCPNKEAP